MDVSARLGNVIMGVRHALWSRDPHNKGKPIDVFMGREFARAFMLDMRLHMLNMVVSPGDLRSGVNFCNARCVEDPGQAPRVAYVAAGGTPVRRLRLDSPEFDKAPLRDGAPLTEIQMHFLRHIQRKGGDVILNAPHLKVLIPQAFGWHDPTEEELAKPVEIQTVHSDDPGLEGLIEFTQRESGRHRLRLTHLGRYALDQASADRA